VGLVLLSKSWPSARHSEVSFGSSSARTLGFFKHVHRVVSSANIRVLVLDVSETGKSLQYTRYRMGDRTAWIWIGAEFWWFTCTLQVRFSRKDLIILVNIGLFGVR
jgi:hypothetical protein